jgi:hypothetical protein
MVQIHETATPVDNFIWFLSLSTLHLSRVTLLGILSWPAMGEASSQVGFLQIWQLQPFFRQMAIDINMISPWYLMETPSWWVSLGCFWGAGGLHYTGAWKGLREPRWDTQPSDLPEATAQCSDMVEMCERSLCWTIFSQRLASMPTSTDIRQIWKFWLANYQYWGINLGSFASGDVLSHIARSADFHTSPEILQ